MCLQRCAPHASSGRDAFGREKLLVYSPHCPVLFRHPFQHGKGYAYGNGESSNLHPYPLGGAHYRVFRRCPMGIPTGSHGLPRLPTWDTAVAHAIQKVLLWGAAGHHGIPRVVVVPPVVSRGISRPGFVRETFLRYPAGSCCVLGMGSRGTRSRDIPWYPAVPPAWFVFRHPTALPAVSRAVPDRAPRS